MQVKTRNEQKYSPSKKLAKGLKYKEPLYYLISVKYSSINSLTFYFKKLLFIRFFDLLNVMIILQIL